MGGGETYPEISGQEVFDLEGLLVEDFPAVEEHDQETGHEPEDRRTGLAGGLVWIAWGRAIVGGMLQPAPWCQRDVVCISGMHAGEKRIDLLPEVETDECKTLGCPDQ